MNKILRGQNLLIFFFIGSLLLIELVIQVFTYNGYKNEVYENLNFNAQKTVSFLSQISRNSVAEYDISAIDNLLVHALVDDGQIVKIAFYDEVGDPISDRKVKNFDKVSDVKTFYKKIVDPTRNGQVVGAVTLSIDMAPYKLKIRKSLFSHLIIFASTFIMMLFLSYIFSIRLKILEKRMKQNAKLIAIGQMSTTVAHEVKNPLAIIMGEVNRIRLLFKSSQELSTNAKLSSYIDNIDFNSNRILHVVKKINSFAHYEHDQSEEIEEISLIPLIHKIYNSMCASQDQDKFDFRIHISDELKEKEILFKGNELLLFQVVSNLVSNAFDALKEQGSFVEISLQLNKGILELIVRDDGPGISEENQERIFDKFFTTKKVGVGTGLGLDIVKDIVTKKLGAKVGLISKLGWGSEFIIKFKDFKIESNVSAKKYEISEQGKKKLGLENILIVDDEDIMREIMGEIIEKSGYIPHFAANGLEALDLIQKYQYHTVIVDLEMPKMNGEELIESIVSQNLKTFRVILNSAHHHNKEHLISKNKNFEIVDHCLTKPTSIESLNEVLAHDYTKIA
ncbi:hybrid sensor histidine kinase/response regulator [Bacteriovorax sp. DB6_IX]|uniref:hybrid sensor histidine kinase/response regulator n=1 Tax=Bacteriovorax sp. DB6_IX TaxID=1353530 RepID=UPI0005583D92|nr:hybrid sensor histidine kinase/response regulator [Bacteriovorax sp. DB6_IX]